MSESFKSLSLSKIKITYLDDVFTQSQTKADLFHVLEFYLKSRSKTPKKFYDCFAKLNVFKKVRKTTPIIAQTLI